MNRDLRSDPLYGEIREYFRRVREPSFGKLSEVAEVQPSPDGRFIALAGTVYESLGGIPPQRIAIFDRSDNSLTLVLGNANDICPRWSPSGQLAFLSDREIRGTMRPFRLEVGGLPFALARELDGSAESLSWSPDGAHLLIRTAGLGADKAGALGSGTVGGPDRLPDWIPDVEQATPDAMWRKVWICSPSDGSIRAAGPEHTTCWEAAWSGTTGIVAILSDDPRESAWHQARLVHISIDTGAVEIIYEASYEIGLPAATPDGAYVAVVEGCCSDRTVVAGDVLLFDRRAGWSRSTVDTDGVAVTSLSSRGDRRFAFAGIRGFEVAAGDIDVLTATASVNWSGRESWLRRYPAVAPVGADEYTTVAHAYACAPKLVSFANGGPPCTLYDFADDGTRYVIDVGGDLTELTWKSRDGLDIQGYLARPRTTAPHPLVVLIHGGPVSAYTNAWQMASPLVPLLVSRGYAVLCPNPRGSSGRGEHFTRLILGDLGGEEMHDTLCGVEMLIRNGGVDRNRIAVMGGSHGGYMAAWMVTQCDLFAAAVALAPVTDCFSCDFTSSDSEFYRLFLASDPFDRDGKHFSRSPIMFARNVTTPTLLVAGGRDRCTPASQAVEFHRALVERGVPSELVVYPNEGHGVRQLEAYIDYCTRVVDWIGTHGSKKAFAITQELVSDSATDQCGHREAEPAR